MAKKKKKKRTGAPAVDPNEARRRRLEAKRQARAEAARAQRRAALRERVLRALLVAGLALAAAWFFFLRGQNPDAIAGHPVESFPETGTNVHQEEVTYEMTPPVTGPHSASAAPCGTHAGPIRDELLVHSLEHGAVAVLFDPTRVDQRTVDAIEEVVSDYPDRTISAPYFGMETPITVVSWGEMMRLDSFEEGAVRQYIEEFRGKGPEDEPCENTVDQHFEVSAQNPTPSPSPTGTPGRGGDAGEGRRGPRDGRGGRGGRG